MARLWTVEAHEHTARDRVLSVYQYLPVILFGDFSRTHSLRYSILLLSIRVYMRNSWHYSQISRHIDAMKSLKLVPFSIGIEVQFVASSITSSTWYFHELDVPTTNSINSYGAQRRPKGRSRHGNLYWLDSAPSSPHR
jgi:hypothetical protein